MKNLSKIIIGLLLFGAQPLQAQTVSVALVWDESESISSSDFNLQMQGYAEALNGLPMNGHIEVTLLGFGSSVFTLADKVILNHSSLNSLQNRLTGRVQSSGGADTAAAITRAATILRASTARAKIICLSTDGLPDDAIAATMVAERAQQFDGITIAPIGVGVNNDSRDFLHSIASQPPVPTPTGFHDFAVVVDNDCGGEITRVLHLSFTPAPVDFGVLSAATSKTFAETIGIYNSSHEPAVITNINVTGEDADYFSISQVFGSPLINAANIEYRFGVFRRDVIEVEFNPRSNRRTPRDGTYDAVLTVTARPDQQNAAPHDFSVSLTARAGPAALSVQAWDAVGIIDRLNNGRPSPQLSEDFLADETRIARDGLVADGNAILFLTANTDRVDDRVKQLQFEIVGTTAARLYQLDGNLLTGGSRSASVDIVELDSGEGQATIILRAGASFPAAVAAAESRFAVRACVEGMCDLVSKQVNIIERRAPAVLIHGLWSSRKTWERSNINMTDFLRRQHFDAHPVDYDGSKNPPPEELEQLLTVRIGDICRGVMHEQGRRLACTKADLLAHSMGGLVARNFIQNTGTYRNLSNFNQGAVRRYIPMATPQQGSPLGNVLLGNHEDARCQLSGLQLGSAKALLEVTGRRVDTAVTDVSVGSDFLNGLNSSRNHPNSVPTHALYGDTGMRISTLVAVLFKLIKRDCTHEAIFGTGNHSDGIVPVDSASDGERLRNTFTLIGQLDHLDMTNNRTAGEQYVKLLNSNLIPDDFVSYAAADQRQQSRFATALPFAAAEGHHQVSLWDKTQRVLQTATAKFLRMTNAFAQQPTPSLSLSASPTTVIPGQDIVLQASLTGSAATPEVLLVRVGSDLAMEDSEPPYEWLVPTSQQTAGTFSFRAVSVVDDEVVASSTVTVLVMPQVNNLVQLRFVPGDLLYMSVGRTEQLKVVGRFHDGFVRDITERATGTTYSEVIVSGVNARAGNSPVIAVDDAGVITALAPGEAEVVAHNHGFSVSRRVMVRADDLSSRSGSSGGGSGFWSPLFVFLLGVSVLAGVLQTWLRRSV